MVEAGTGAVVQSANEQLLLDKLSDPHTVEQLVRILDKLEDVTFLLDMFESFLRRGPEIADSINDLVCLMRQNLSKPEYAARFEGAFAALRQMQAFFESPQVQELFRSDVLDVRAVQMVGKVSRSMIQASADTAHSGTKRVGLFGLLQALSDPEIQPALNFIINFARHLSRELSSA